MKQIKFLLTLNLEDHIIKSKHDVAELANKIYDSLSNEWIFGSKETANIELITDLDVLIQGKDPYRK